MSLLLFQTLFLFLIPGSYVLVWQKGNDVLTARNIMVSPDRRFKLQPDHTLELKNIKPSDGGDYTCKISVLGDPILITHTLEILCKYLSYFTYLDTSSLMKYEYVRKKWLNIKWHFQYHRIFIIK